MKTTLTLHPQLMRDLWFRALSPHVRLFWLHILTESDTAGWWQPEWEVTNAWLKLPEPLDPVEVQRVLEAAGQIKVHPSGWWELTHYRAQQYPNGLSESFAYHKSVLKVLNAHLKREAALTSSTSLAEPAQRQGLDPAGLQVQGGGQKADTSGIDGSSIKSQSPGPGQGPKAQAPARAQDQDQAPTGGQGDESPTGYDGEARAMALVGLRSLLQAHGLDPATEGLDLALEGLLDGLGLAVAQRHLKAWLKGSRAKGDAPTAAELVAWLRDRRASCAHAPAGRVWWTDKHRRKHWRCTACGHHQEHQPRAGDDDA
jgi:hypothetical protein